MESDLIRIGTGDREKNEAVAGSNGLSKVDPRRGKAPGNDFFDDPGLIEKVSG